MKLPSWKSLSRKSVLLGVFLVEHTIPVSLCVFMMVSPVLKQTALKCVDVRLDSGFPFKSRQAESTSPSFRLSYRTTGRRGNRGAFDGFGGFGGCGGFCQDGYPP